MLWSRRKDQQSIGSIHHQGDQDPRGENHAILLCHPENSYHAMGMEVSSPRISRINNGFESDLLFPHSAFDAASDQLDFSQCHLQWSPTALPAHAQSGCLNQQPAATAFLNERDRPAMETAARPGCLAVSLSLVESLRWSRERCRYIKPSQTRERLAETPGVLAMDVVLSRNSISVDDLVRILECMCSRQRCVQLLCFAAAEQILGWYTAAAGLQLASSTGLDYTIVPSTVYLGSYRLACSAADHVQLVARDMQGNIPRMLSKFQEVCRPADEMQNDRDTVDDALLENFRCKADEVVNACGVR